jgi:hypothetical protein
LPLNRAPLPSAAPDDDYHEVVILAALVRQSGGYTPQKIHAATKGTYLY